MFANAGLMGQRGVMLGTFAGRYLRHDGPEHVLAVAPTRSGKGVGIVVPTLLSWTHSTIVHDIKGENWRLTAGWRSQFSHCIRFDPTSGETARFNPLLEVCKGPHEVRDAQNIADILVDPEGAHHPDHWDKTAHALLTGAILHVLYAEADKTLHGVATFLADPASDPRRNARRHADHQPCRHGGERPRCTRPLRPSARVLLNMGDNERSSVVSTAVRALTLYRDPIIAAATAASDWSIGDLVGDGRPVSLYLVVPPSDLARTRPLMRLVLNQILRRLTEQLPTEDDQRVTRQKLLLMLDEFPALGRLPFFAHALAFLAGYGVRAVLIAQSLNQLDKAYGANNAILDNCHVRVAFAPNDERTARRISDALGTATELRTQENLSGARTALWLNQKTVATHETPRPLLTPGEVMQLPGDEELVLVSGVPPIRAGKIPQLCGPCVHRTPVPRAPEQPTGSDASPAIQQQMTGPRRHEAASSCAAVPKAMPDIAANTNSKTGDLHLLDDAPVKSRAGRPRSMSKSRYSIMLPHELAERLELAAKRRHGAKSAIVAEALDKHLNPERYPLIGEALHRRLDGVSKDLAVVGRDVAIATETVALFVRYFLTITPPLPEPEQEAARALGRERFQVFVAQIGRRLASDHRLVSEVLETIAERNPDLFATASDDAPLKDRNSHTETLEDDNG